MIQSMTGYGKADTTFGHKKIHVEVKSLNSKSLDLTVRLAPIYREKEMQVRRYVAERLERGKIELSLWVEADEVEAGGHINKEAVNSYVHKIDEISREIDIAAPLNYWEIVMRLPEVIQNTGDENLSDEEWKEAMSGVRQAVDALISFRQQEGIALSVKFNEKIDNIADLLAKIAPLEQGRVEKIRQRLEERLAELKGIDYDRGRLEQELIFYIEKLDISEEKQRLTNHLEYFRKTMNEGVGQGKKLGFIAQEMGREINTTGSKSNQAEMQNLVVKMKDELEQIKEQVLNVL